MTLGEFLAERDTVAIGTSAGGVEALRYLASRLSPDFPATILVVIHIGFRSSLDAILSSAGPLPATFGKDGETIGPGHIYIGPPGKHLLLEDRKLRLGTGPPENSSKPAIDPLFRSVALCCGSRSIGVVLTGALGDGSSGLWALKECGGISVVQDPEDAAFPGMPRSALSRGKIDFVEKLGDLPGLLEALVHHPAGPPVVPPHRLRFEVEVAKQGLSKMSELDRIGRRSVIACPDCHGVMWEIEDGDAPRYRCHVGHAYSAEFLELALDANLNRALASAQRALEERTAVSRSLEQQAIDRGRLELARSWSRRAEDFEREGEIIRDAITRLDEMAFRRAQAEHQADVTEEADVEDAE